MAVRQSQQIRVIAYTTDPEARLSSLKVESLNAGDAGEARLSSMKAEVLYSTGAAPPAPSGAGAIMIVIASG